MVHCVQPEIRIFPISLTRPTQSILPASSFDPTSSRKHLLLLPPLRLILPAPPPHAKERNEKEKAEGPGRRLTSEQVERVPGDNLHLCGKDKEKLKRTWVFLFWVFFFGAGCEGGELGRGGRLIEIWSKRVEEEREREKGGISSSARVERRSHSKKGPALTFFTEISLEKDQDPSRRAGPCSNQNSR